MQKMMSLTYFAFTPAYGSYVADKVMSAGPAEDVPATEFAHKGLYGRMKTDMGAIR